MGSGTVARLEVRDLSVSFGVVRAVDGVDLRVEAGQVVGLIGPNGAGKTTFVDAIGGFVPSRGRVELDGRDLTRLAPHGRARAGLARTWQTVELFDDLTVAENLEVAAASPDWRQALADVVHRRGPGSTEAVGQALAAVDLTSLGDRRPSELSQGQRKLVGVARALAARPRLVCLDEPAAGLDTTESKTLGAQLRSLTTDGTALLLIDHDMGLVLDVSDHVYVLDAGRVIAHGPPREVRADERVIGAYLGESSR